MPCKNTLDVLYLLLQVLHDCYGLLARTILIYSTKTTTVIYQVCYFNVQQDPTVVKFDSTKAGETDTREPPLCKTSCMSIGGTGHMNVVM